MMIIICLVLLSGAMAKEDDSGLYINETEQCTLMLEFRLPNRSIYAQYDIQGITSAAFSFRDVQWATTEDGLQQGYLNSSSAEAFIKDVQKSLYIYENPPSKPSVVAYCLFNVEIPGVSLIFKQPLKPNTEKPPTPTHRHHKPLTSNRPTSPPLTDYSVTPSTIVPTHHETYKCNHPHHKSGNLNPWIWVGIGAAVTGTLFCIGILICMTLHYRKKVKELESKEIPASIRSRPPLALPPEVVYDAVYSHRINRLRKWKPRYIPIEERTASAIKSTSKGSCHEFTTRAAR